MGRKDKVTYMPLEPTYVTCTGCHHLLDRAYSRKVVTVYEWGQSETTNYFGPGCGPGYDLVVSRSLYAQIVIGPPQYYRLVSYIHGSPQYEEVNADGSQLNSAPPEEVEALDPEEAVEEAAPDIERFIDP